MTCSMCRSPVMGDKPCGVCGHKPRKISFQGQVNALYKIQANSNLSIFKDQDEICKILASFLPNKAEVEADAISGLDDDISLTYACRARASSFH
jgi:hypothetical protein